MPERVPIFGANEIDQSPGSVSLSSSPFWDNYFSAGASAAPRAPVGLNTANADAARTWQQQLIQDLQQQAAGNPNSKAQKGLTGAYTEARAGQSALGSSMRGTGGGAGLRAGAKGAGEVQRSFEGDKKLLMLQEQQAAQAALAQMLAQTRGMDAQQAAMMAANAQQNQGLEDAMRQFYTNGQVGGGIAAAQRGVDAARAAAGIQDGRTALGQDAMNAGLAAGGTLLSVGANYASRGGGGSRQVDGQNSIVPSWDK